MNGELPPVDPRIREQLARRSAGRLPDGLVAEITAAIDTVSIERPRRMRSVGPTAWRAPQLAAAACVALVVVLGAALLVVPRFVTSPAGNGSYTALTTSELASLLAAGTQPATNTTLVATVTVDSRNDVCPMDRYPTLGVVEAMGSQVCVMGADTNSYLSTDRVNAAKVTGTFAFRYLAPGYLGLLGQLTLPATGIAFGAAGDWPLQGGTFLVDGWLGTEELLESCVTTQPAQPAGDVLMPNGADCPYDDWLGTEATAPGLAADHVTTASAEPSHDPLALRGNARHVEAGGMRIIDSIDHSAPVHGVYVVRSVTVACPNASPIDSRGCGAWRVLARVSDTSLHAPTTTPAATSTPAASGAYPADRALTPDELARLLAGPAPATNTALVASVTIDPQPDACPLNSRPTYGVIHGIEPQVCVVGPIGDTGSVAGGQNVFAFRYLGSGVLGLLGLVQPAAASRLAHAVADDWSQAGKVFAVEGWLGADPIPCPSLDSAQSVDPLNPVGVCGQDWMSDEDPNTPPKATGSLTVPKRLVLAGGMRLVDELPGEPAARGVYVVRNGAPGSCGTASTDSGNCGVVLAKLADLTLPKVTPSPSTTPSPTPTPTAKPAATPTTAPPATPVIPSGGATVGLFGDGNRPLTAAEFASIWASDPTHLAGRIVIAKGPVPTGFRCGNIIVDSSAHRPGCADLSTQSGYVAQEGYWAVRVGADGKLAIVGQISTLTTGFVYTLDQVNASTTLKPDDLVMVSGWLLEHVPTCDYGPPLPSACGPFSAIDSTASDNSPAGIGVQLGAYEQFTGTAGDWMVEGPPVQGTFLVRVTNGDIGTLLARLEVAIP